MQIPVLIEKVPGDGFRARGGEPLALTADGATADEAISKLRDLIERRLADGTQVVSIELPESNAAWRSMGGMYADDPLYDEWQAAIKEYRNQ